MNNLIICVLIFRHITTEKRSGIPKMFKKIFFFK